MGSIGSTVSTAALALVMMAAALGNPAGAAAPRDGRLEMLRPKEISIADLERRTQPPALIDFRDDRVEVKPCDWLWTPEGMVPVGPGCLGPGNDGGSPGHSSDGPDPAPEDDSEPTGCPYDYFPEDEWFTTETRFALPLENPVGKIAPHPGVIHMDNARDPDVDKDLLDCVPYEDGRLCYGNHEGTDFMMLGSFLMMDYANLWVTAAADGVVMKLVDDQFDRCSVDTRAGSTVWVENPSYGEIVCVNGICGPDLRTGWPVWVGNPNFMQIVCDEETEAAGQIDKDDTNRIEICHRDGTISRYAHVMKDTISDDLEEGSPVSCGQRLALVGSSGRSSAPHLHFDVKLLDPETGERFYVDPFAADDDESLWLDQTDDPGQLPSASCE